MYTNIFYYVLCSNFSLFYGRETKLTLIILNYLKANYKAYDCIFISLLLITDLTLQSHPGLEFYPFLCVNNEELFL